jgi:hypothetical protein
MVIPFNPLVGHTFIIVHYCDVMECHYSYYGMLLMSLKMYWLVYVDFVCIGHNRGVLPSKYFLIIDLQTIFRSQFVGIVIVDLFVCLSVSVCLNY